MTPTKLVLLLLILFPSAFAVLTPDQIVTRIQALTGQVTALVPVAQSFTGTLLGIGGGLSPPISQLNIIVTEVNTLATDVQGTATVTSSTAASSIVTAFTAFTQAETTLAKTISSSIVAAIPVVGQPLSTALSQDATAVNNLASALISIVQGTASGGIIQNQLNALNAVLSAVINTIKRLGLRKRVLPSLVRRSAGSVAKRLVGDVRVH
ncbi:hypothetical protein HDV00_004290 [Rhizophlyctis rosea]|nr:hypothetical protein HDV00_004290 [Rhizophlyctis rosea]